MRTIPASLLLCFGFLCSRMVFAQPCLFTYNFEAMPPPVDGHYGAGQTVFFCFTVEDWDQTNVNWLHGAVPILGPGWDLNSLELGPPPDGCGMFAGTWLLADSVTGTSETNIGPQGPGWFFDLDNDGDAGNNFGDDCLGPWHFCFLATVKDSVDCVDGTDLSVWVDTFGDSETGSWGIAGCTGDTVPQFPASTLCFSSLPLGLPARSLAPLLTFPTLFADAFTVRNAGPAGKLLFFDTTGRLVRTVPLGARAEQTMPRGALSSGIYRLLFQDGSTGQQRYAGSVAAE